MFRILIVEDDPPTLKMLQTLFFEVFLDSKIDTAKTVEKGLQLIKAALVNNWSYHVVVPDFKLPRDKGSNPEVDESICLEIKNTMPNTFIVHITGFPDDLIILKHMREVHLDRRNPPGELTSKLEANWPEQLVGKMKAYLYGTHIEEKMDRLFGTYERSATEPRSQRHSRSRSEGSVTHELASLCRDIIAHWSDLDERLQKRIKETFYVDDSGDRIRISLL